jgi:ABC-type transporter Mla maintaining outer membrane lipid asymmetry ATPase subunit MlaF
VTADPVIAVEGLVKDYRGLRPLRLEHLRISAGDRIALSGLDATAAEVLVNLVNGAILPDEGDIRVFGQSTRAIANETAWFALLDRFGIVTPRAVLLESSTVAQNLALPFTIDLEAIDPDTGERGARLASEVGLAASTLLERACDLAPEHRMRIHLARALATDPQVLLLEHPTAPLARAHVRAFAECTARVAERRALTVLAITEDDEFAGAVATERFRLQAGTGALVAARGWRRWFRSP